MSVSRRDAYDSRYGRIRIGKCFVCGDSVYNYHYAEFRVSKVYIDDCFSGYCHEACYNRWNPILGICPSCGRKVRSRNNPRKHNVHWYHYKCYNELQLRRSVVNRPIVRQQNYSKPAYTSSSYNVAKAIAKDALIQTVTYSFPIARELYVTYKAADTLYNVWNEVREAYKNPEREAYNLTNSYTSSTIANMQTNLIWTAIENKLPYTGRYEVKQVLNDVISTVTDKEIDYVQRQLRYDF